MQEVFPSPGPLRGIVEPPPDKSITHRALLLAAEADGLSLIRNPSMGADCLATVSCLRQLGVEIEAVEHGWRVPGRGLGALAASTSALDARNSGTTLRLLSGILARHSFNSTLTGDDSLCRRPMERVAAPLRLMGAAVETADGMPPLRIRGTALRGIDYSTPVASAQVKSCVLFAGLGAAGPTIVREPLPTRDHTERLFSAAGIPIAEEKGMIVLSPVAAIRPLEITIPGDPSAAAFFAAAAALVPGSVLTLKNVGLNLSRTAFFDALRRMGAGITVQVREPGEEPRGDILAAHGALRAVRITGEEVPGLVDEIPLLAVLAAFAEGTTLISGAAELRKKESDRIAAVAENLRRMGADVEEAPDGLAVYGPTGLRGAEITTRGDHRIAMAFAVAALAARGATRIDDGACAAVSYPGFFDELRRVAST